MRIITQALILFVMAAAALEFTRDANAFGLGELGSMFGKLGAVQGGGVAGGSGGPPANSLLAQTGVCVLAQTGNCILVQ